MRQVTGPYDFGPYGDLKLRVTYAIPSVVQIGPVLLEEMRTNERRMTTGEE